MLLDGLTVVLFVGGCLLFWLKFRARHFKNIRVSA
jgi:hypothetical protein